MTQASRSAKQARKAGQKNVRASGWSSRLLCGAMVCLAVAGCSSVGQSNRSTPKNRSIYSYQYQKPAKKSEPSFFGSLFGQKEEEPPKSVKDFLKQPQVKLPPAA